MFNLTNICSFARLLKDGALNLNLLRRVKSMKNVNVFVNQQLNNAHQSWQHSASAKASMQKLNTFSKYNTFCSTFNRP